MGKVLISPDEDNFTLSVCKCEFCQDMHKSLREWDTFTAKTAVQRNMLRIVDRLENNTRKVLLKSRRRVKTHN